MLSVQLSLEVPGISAEKGRADFEQTTAAGSVVNSFNSANRMQEMVRRGHRMER